MSDLCSKQWSCATFSKGIEEVMAIKMETPDGDAELVSRIQELQAKLSTLEKDDVSDDASPEEADIAEVETIPAALEDVYMCTQVEETLEDPGEVAVPNAPEHEPDSSTQAMVKENDELKKLLQEAMVQLQAMKKQSVPTENKAHKAPATQPSSVNSTPKSHEKVSGQSPGAGSKSGSDKSHVEASSSPTPSNLKTPPARSSEQAVDNSVESAPKKQKTGDEKVEISDEAAQARLRRICERKPSGRIRVPEWLHRQWLDVSLRRGLLASFKQCKMNQEQFVEKQRVIYERKKTKSLTNLVGWHSDRTMKDDLKWPEAKRKIAMDAARKRKETRTHYGEEQFWIDVQTTGSIGEQEEETERREREEEVADDAPALNRPVCSRLDSWVDSGSGGANTEASVMEAGSPESLKNFMSSVLSKTSKLHALAAELQKKHPDDSRAVAALDDINKQCKAMEAEYETLNTLQTKGELKGFGPLKAEIEQQMEKTTYVCSTALAAEMRIRNAKKTFFKAPAEKPADGAAKPAIPKAKKTAKKRTARAKAQQG